MGYPNEKKQLVPLDLHYHVFSIRYSVIQIWKKTVDPLSPSHNEGIKSKASSGPEEVAVCLVLEEVYDINISKGDFNIVAETTLKWHEHEHIIECDKPVIFTGSDIDKKLSKIWHPTFTIYNAESPRQT